LNTSLAARLPPIWVSGIIEPLQTFTTIVKASGKKKAAKAEACRLHSGRYEEPSDGIHNFLIGVCLRLF
jgi:hypothetical protein